ncbi:MAG: HlyD family efflux transporter periplasmic adaptor subunit [Candidatus Omnitrophota bacterium]
MIKKRKFLFIILVILAAIAAALFFRAKAKGNSRETIQIITPARGTIRTVISTTGLILPKNRLEIKPPVNGRIEMLLVKEGDMVRDGEILAWMSSTERAALLDAAQSQGEEKLKYWEEAYKPIALLAPIDGEVIVATTQPGQTVTTADAVIVLSDKLIVRAQVDETDIGKIRLSQQAIVSLDAYPDTSIDAVVEHIYYESKTVNNVTIYEVDLLPAEIPPFCRSGMNATVDFIEANREGVLLIPLEAVHREKEQDFVLVEEGADKEPLKRPVKLGIFDDKNIEVISGIGAKDRIVVKTKEFALPKNNNTGSNPFMPSRRR